MASQTNFFIFESLWEKVKEKCKRMLGIERSL